jgi:hypothetical protein
MEIIVIGENDAALTQVEPYEFGHHTLIGLQQIIVVAPCRRLR